MAIGSIVWKLLMDTAGFQTDSKRAASNLKELKNEAKETQEKLSGLTETFLGFGLSVGGVVYAMKETIDKMDETAKSAARVGTSAEELSKLQYAASLSAVSNEELQGALQKVAKQAADANPAFEAMGIKVKGANGELKDSAELFKEVAGKMAGYKDGSQKTALAIELFGRSGANLLPLLNQGAEGLAAMGEEAAALGGVIGNEAAKSAEEFNDKLTKLKTAGFGMLMQGVEGAMPALQDIASAFVDGAKKGDGFKEVGVGVGNVLKALTSMAVGVATSFQLVGQGLGGLMAALDQPLSGKGLKTAGAILHDTWSDMGTIAESAGKRINDIWSSVGKGAKEAGEAGAGANSKIAQTAAPVVRALGRQKEAATKLKDELKKVMDAMMKEGETLTKSLQSPADKLLQKQADISRLRAVGAIDQGTADKANAQAMKAYQDVVDQQRDLLSAGLLSEEDEIRKSYDRRKAQILQASELTETEKQQGIADLSAKMDSDINAASLNRYKDLMTADQQITIDYEARKAQIYDDSALSTEKRNEYLTALAQKYHDDMTKLDDDAAAKRDAANQKTIDLMSSGFAGMADLTKTFAGEQSDAYKAMFAASKAFAIADITIKQSQAIAKAWGENNYWVAAGLTIGLVSQFASLISSTNSASFGGTRADGGPVNGGRTYLVGERGPELFTAPESGRIISNSDLQPSSPQVNVRNVNAYDTSHVADFMGSGSGERVIMNVIRKNGATVRALNKS